MAAHSTKRNGRSEPKRDRSLQTLPRYAARSRHSPILHDVPLGFAASAEDRGGWPNRDLSDYFADYAEILAKNLGDRVTVWAPFNMPWSFTYLGYGVGIFPPGRSKYTDFLKAAHTVSLAQGKAFRSIKDASSKATD